MRAEPVLIHRPAAYAFLAASPALGMGGAEPVQKLTDCLGVSGLGKEMPVIWHDAVGEKNHCKFGRCLAKNLQHLEVIGGVMKKGELAGCPVAKVKDNSWRAGASFSGHIR